MKPVSRGALVALVGATCILGGCASLTYEAEEWRVAVPPDGNAHAVVRYIGIGAATKNAAEREKLVRKIHALAGAEAPGSAYAPLLRHAQRKVYLEGDKIVLEESGDVRNPFSWFEQTGLNPVGWFSGSLKLVQKDNHIVKRGIDDNTQVLASDGRIVDEDTYTSILKGKLPFDLSCDTQWQRREDLSADEDVRDERLKLIMWPRVARTFYWRLGGPALGKRWQSLTTEYQKKHPDTPRQKAPIDATAAAAEKKVAAERAAKEAKAAAEKAATEKKVAAERAAKEAKAAAEKAATETNATNTEIDEDPSTIK